MRYLRTLRLVDEVARAGSIRKAAVRLNLDPTALNRRILDMEAELDVPLFERMPRGMRPTAAGELLLRHTRAQLAEVEALQSRIADLRGLRRGQVRVAASQAVAAKLLPMAIASFHTENPGIRFATQVLDQQAALAELEDYAVDLIFVVAPPASRELLPLARVDQSVVAVMAVDHPLARHTVLGLSQCADWPLALPDAALTTRRLIEDAFGQLGLPLRVTFECNAFAPLWQTLHGTGAVSFQVALGAPPPEGENGLISRPLLAGEVSSVPLVLGQLRGRALPVAAARFVEMLRSRLSGEVDGTQERNCPPSRS